MFGSLAETLSSKQVHVTFFVTACSRPTEMHCGASWEEQTSFFASNQVYSGAHTHAKSPPPNLSETEKCCFSRFVLAFLSLSLAGTNELNDTLQLDYHLADKTLTTKFKTFCLTKLLDFYFCSETNEMTMHLRRMVER